MRKNYDDITNSEKRDAFAGSLKRSEYISWIRKIGLSMIVGLLLTGVAEAVTYYSRTTGNWNSNSTWSTSSGGSAGSAFPVAGDIVIIERGYTVTVTADALCTSITFSGTNSSNALVINSSVSLTVSGAVTLNSDSGSDTKCGISGAGTLNCATVSVGQSGTNPSSNRSTTMTLTLLYFNCSETFTLNATRNNSKNNNPNVNLQSGVLSITGALTTVNASSSNTSTFNMNSGAASATLNLGTSPSLSANGSNTITFRGGTQTVNYNGAAETIIATTYNNLTLSGTLAKTFPSGTTTVSGILSREETATATVTGTLSYGQAATLQYKGSAAQTTGSEFPATFSGSGGVIIANTSGNAVTLSGAKTINALLTINSSAKLNLGTSLTHSANSLILGGAGQIAGTYSYSGLGGPTYFANATGTLTVSSTLNTWTGATSTDWHVATNWSAGTVPVSSTSVTIPSGGNQPLIGAAALCSNITILGGAILTINGSNTLTVSGNWINSGTFTRNTSTVNFNGTAQSIGAGPFYNLTLSNSNTKTLTGVTVNGVLSMEGSATVSTAPTYGSSATLQYNTTSSRTSGSEWLSTFAATGGVIIAGTGEIKLNNDKVFNTSVPLTINSGASLNTDGSNNRSLTFGGNFTKNGTGVLTANSSSITITGTMASQSIAGFTTTGNISMTKSGGTATFAGNVNGAKFTINGTGGTLNLGVGLTHSFSDVITLTKGTLNGGSSTLNVNKSSTTAWGGTGSLFVAGSGTVNFGASGNQTLSATTTIFNNLKLSSTSTKTFSNANTVNGIFSIEGTATPVLTGALIYGTSATLQYKTTDTRTAGTEWPVSFNAAGGVIIANSSGSVTMNSAKVFNTAVPLTINSGATLVTNNLQLTLGGNFVRTGTFTAGSSIIAITGTMAAQSIGAFSTTGAVTMTKTSGTATFTGVVGGGSLALNGAGTLKLSAANTYSGATTLNAGTLIFAASNALTSSSIVLNGGTLKSGITTGYSATTNATLNMSSNSTLALGTGAHSLTSATGSPGWSNYATLTITGWTGSYNGTTGSAGKIFAGAANSGLTAQQLSQIQFKNGSSYYQASILETGEVVPTATPLTFFNLSYSSPNTYISTSAITPLSPTITGTPTGYSVSPALPAGLSINATTGVISGSPTTTSAINTYVVTATNGVNTTLFGVVISVHIPTTYYAKATGNWDAPGTWSLVSGASSSVSATTVPVAGDIASIGDAAADGVRTVTIPSGYSAGAATVNLGSSVAYANNLTLADLTSSLAVSGNITITRSGTSSITNSLNVNAGAVTVGGNLTMSGNDNTTSRITRIVTTTGTLTIAGNLTLPSSIAANNVIDMSGGAGTLNLGGAFTLGLGTLTPGTTSTFNFNGSAAQNIPIGVSSIVYNNITVNNSNGSGATFITNGITNTRVTGDLSVQSGILNNGGLAITLASDKSFSLLNSATFNLSGTSTMAAVSGAGTKTFGATSTTNYAGTGQTVTNETYGHLILSGSGAKAISAGATTQGDFTISGSAAVTAGGILTIAGNVILGSGTSFTAGAYNHIINGNWTNNGTTFTNTGSTISFSNSVDQTITGSATTVFNNLTVIKDPAKLIISTATKVAGTLTMTSGNIQAGALFELGTSTSAAGILVWTSGNIIGCFKRWVDATASDIQFPVGTKVNNNMAVTNFTNLTNGSLTVCFTASNPGSSGLPLTDGSDVVDRQFTEGYWSLTASDGLASTDYLLTLAGNGFISYTEDNTVRILRRVDNSSPWTFDGSAEAGTAPVSGRSGLSVFGEFAHGRVNPCAVTASSVVKTDASCFGGSTGSITISGLSGAANYQFSIDGSDWSNTDGIFTGLGANTYYVEMRDASNATCIVTLGDQVVSQPSVLNALVSKTNVNCNGGSTGTISVSSPSGGAGTYQYRLDEGTWQSGGSFTGLAANTYSVQIRDAVNTGCVVILGNQIITQPSALTLSTPEVNPTCFSNGSITPSVGGGTYPYIYDWTDIPGANNAANRTGVVAGTYNLTVTDANGCTISSGDLVITAASGCTGIDVCKSNAAKVFSVTPDPKVDYYIWTVPSGASIVGPDNTASITVDFRSVSLGVYQVVVKSHNNCASSPETTLTVYVNAPTATASVIGSACEGSNLQLSAGGGQTYSWTGPDGFISSSANPVVYNAASGINEGIYIATVTDQKGCIATANVSVTLNLPPTATAVISDATCGTSSGAIDLSPSGSSPFTFLWSNGATTEDIASIQGANYGVSVTDNLGCTYNGSFVVSNTGGPTGTVSITNVLCNGSATGAITLTPSGGTGPYTYSWSRSNGVSFATSRDLSDLSAGTYNVIITDATGCTGAATATITQPNAIQIANTITNINCRNASTGSVNITVTGGTGSFTYGWSGPGEYTASSQNIASRPVGTYNLTVHDGSCTATASYTITQPSAVLSASTSVTNVKCNGTANGVINLTVAGGTLPYGYSWTRSGGYTALTEDVSGLIAGTYDVTVTDARGCTVSSSGEVTQPSSLTLSKTQTNVSCNSGSDGAINLTVSGGTPGTDPLYTFVWSNGAVSEDLSGLSAGVYSVIVTDANGCTATISATISEPDILTASAVSTSPLCFSGNGSVNLTAGGGTTDYTFLWSNSATSEDLGSVAAGLYSVTVTDSKGCRAVASATVTKPAAITVSGSVTAVKCYGASTGAINITAAGGTGAFTYDWADLEGAANSEDRTGLAAGTYTVTVKDANNCSSSATGFIITQPAAAISPGMVNSNVTCKNSENGSINLTVTGGVSPYTYLWTGGATTEDVTGLAPGNYSVTVTDANLCTAELTSSTLTQPLLSLTVSKTITDVKCMGGADGIVLATGSGGTGTISYSWSTGATTASISNLIAGNYNVVATDINGCTATASATVSQPALQIELFAIATEASSCGGPTGSIDLTVVNGNTPFSYSWTNTGQEIQDPSALVPETYTVTVTDNIGCVKILPVTIGTATTLSVSVTTYPKTCLSTDGSAYAIVTGGVAPYSFKWNNGAVSQDITGLAAGTFIVTVTDANGCSASNSGTVGSISCLPPAVADDIFTTNYNTLLNGTVATNDSDPDGESTGLEYFIETVPDNATGIIEWGTDYDGTFTFTPAEGYAGTFSISYKVFDLTGLSTEGVITITVGPDAVNDPVGTSLNFPYSGNVATNDVYEAGSTFTKLTNPVHGSVIFNPAGTFTYTPATDFAGDDSFTYKVCLEEPNNLVCSTGTVFISVAGEADMKIVITVDNSTPDVGSNAVFTLKATNNGPNMALGVVVTNELPSGYTYISNSVPDAGSFVSGTGIWTIGSLVNGEIATIKITVKVNATGGYICNSSVESTSNDPEIGNNSSALSTTPVPQTDLGIVNTVNNPSQNVGGTVIFTLTITNYGPSNATGVVVNNLLPDGYTYISDNGAGAYNSTSGDWTKGSMAKSATGILAITATVKASGNYTSLATVSSTTEDQVTGNNSSSASTVPGAVSDLSIAKTLNNSAPYAGGIVEFTLVATNNGPSTATGVKVTDLLPTGYTYVSDNGSGAYASGTGIWTIGSMVNAATSTLKIVAKIKASGVYTNTATIATTDQPDSDETDNSSGVTPSSVVAQGDLAIVCSVDKPSPVIGENIVFTLTVTNNGMSSAAGVSVTDVLPGGYTYVSNTSPSAGSFASGTGIWTIGAMAYNETATLTITALVKATGSFINTATVSASTADLTTWNNSSSKTINPTPVLIITDPAAKCSPSTVNITLPAVTSGSTSGLTYTYWTDASATVSYANPTTAVNGTYYIKGTTSLGGFVIRPVVVTVNANPTSPVTGVVTQPSCSSASGSVALSVLPASGTWTVTESGSEETLSGSGTTASFTGLATGTKTFTVTASSGCTSVASSGVVINAQPATPVVTTGTITNPAGCGENGSLVLNFTNVPDASYAISYGSGSFSNIAVSGGTATIAAKAGTYNDLRITANGCTSVTGKNAELSDPTSLTAAVIGTIKQPDCSLATGSVELSGLPEGTRTITPSGGTPVTGTGTTFTFEGLTAAATYTFRVTNSVGCTSPASAGAVINTQPSTPSTPVAEATLQPTCSVETGTISVSEPTGVGMTYSIDGSVYTNTTGVFLSVAAGAYTVSAKSTGGCISSGTAVTITAQPAKPAAPVGSASQSFCQGNLPSVADLSITGTFIKWYSAETGGTVISGSASLVNGTVYYASQKVGGCESSARKAVTASVLTCTGPSVADKVLSIDENSVNGTSVTNTNDNTTGTDKDPDGHDLVYTITGGNSSGAFAIDNSTGIITVADASKLDYESAHSFILTVSANNGTISDDAVITINVNNLNDNAPVSVPDSYSLNEGGTLTISAPGALSNDADGDGNTMTAIKVTNPVHGTLTLNADGSLTYIHDGSETTGDSFTYKASDGLNSGNTITVTIIINPVNDAPIAGNIAKSSAEDAILNFTATDFTGSFTDADGNSLSKVKITSLPLNGKLKLAGVNVNINDEITASDLASLTFVPDDNWNGTTSFGWNGSDGTLYAESNAAVNINISPVNDTPDINVPVLGITLNENGGSNTIDISGNISNPEGDVLTTTITIPPDHGTATTDGSGNIVYNPEPGFTGTDTFTYQVCDNGSPSLCVTGTVKIEVTAIVIVNRVPEIVEISKTMVQNETILFEEPDFNSAFTDADNDKLVKVRIVSLPVSGSLRLNGIDVLALQEIPGEDLNSLEYISEPGFSGEMIFSWQASDGKDYSLTTYVRITVTPLEVFVPEGFSPNGDGINDYFVIKGADVNVVILSIFNRWGNLVYESKHYQNDWDGVANAGLLVSSKLPDGTYYYIIDFNNGEKSGIGYITINR